MESKSIKDFYTDYADHIVAKRSQSKYPLRAYVHRKQYESVLSFVEPGMKVLDAGCGEGVLSFLMHEKGAIVTGTDISNPNIENCTRQAREKSITEGITFQVADIEKLPFADNFFDLVVSSHVLEHVPDFNKGLSEILRVTKKRAIVAIPTVNNPCSWVQVGRGWFYLKGLRSFLALPYGFLLTLFAKIRGLEGVDETYAGQGMPHIFRFMNSMKKRISDVGAKLVSYEASSICLPYFSFLLPIITVLDKHKRKKILRNFGYGTTFVIEK